MSADTWNLSLAAIDLVMRPSLLLAIVFLAIKLARIRVVSRIGAAIFTTNAAFLLAYSHSLFRNIRPDLYRPEVHLAIYLVFWAVAPWCIWELLRLPSATIVQDGGKSTGDH